MGIINKYKSDDDEKKNKEKVIQSVKIHMDLLVKKENTNKPLISKLLDHMRIWYTPM